jgi:hypothetical protein
MVLLMAAEPAAYLSMSRQAVDRGLVWAESKNALGLAAALVEHLVAVSA